MRVGQQQPQLIGASLVTSRKICMHAHLQQHQTQPIGASLVSHAEATQMGMYSSFNLSVFCDMYKQRMDIWSSFNLFVICYTQREIRTFTAAVTNLCCVTCRSMRELL